MGGAFLHSYNALCTSLPSPKHLIKIDLTILTPDSARPLDLGLKGADNSCFMPFASQKRPKKQNCGPPSDQTLCGQPNMLNHVFKSFLTDVEVVTEA